jgi:hypothetical protein
MYIDSSGTYVRTLSTLHWWSKQHKSLLNACMDHGWSHSHTTTTLVNFGASCVCPTKIEGYERPENEAIDILHESQYLLKLKTRVRHVPWGHKLHVGVMWLGDVDHGWAGGGQWSPHTSCSCLPFYIGKRMNCFSSPNKVRGIYDGRT